MLVYFRVLIVLQWLFIPQPVMAKTVEYKKQCGNDLYIISVEMSENYLDSPIIKLYREFPKKKRVFLYEAEEYMHFDADCITDRNNKNFFIFNESCGGSACPDDVYGIYDPEKNKIILRPREWRYGNTREVEKILGKCPLMDIYENVFFCCTEQIRIRRNELRKKHDVYQMNSKDE